MGCSQSGRVKSVALGQRSQRKERKRERERERELDGKLPQLEVSTGGSRFGNAGWSGRGGVNSSAISLLMETPVAIRGTQTSDETHKCLRSPWRHLPGCKPTRLCDSRSRSLNAHVPVYLPRFVHRSTLASQQHIQYQYIYRSIPTFPFLKPNWDFLRICFHINNVLPVISMSR